MTQVFISYARSVSESERVKKFAAQLENDLGLSYGDPVSVFQDSEAIHTGERWAERIEAELDASDALIILVSPLWFAREWCLKEYDRFRERNGNAAIFPAEWNRTEAPIEPQRIRVWEGLRAIQWADCRALRTKEVGGEAYLTAVEALAGTLARGIRERRKRRSAPQTTIPTPAKQNFGDRLASCVRVEPDGNSAAVSRLGLCVGEGAMVTVHRRGSGEAVPTTRGSKVRLDVDGVESSLPLKWEGEPSESVVVFGYVSKTPGLNPERAGERALEPGASVEVVHLETGEGRLLSAGLTQLANKRLGIMNAPAGILPGAAVFQGERWVGIAGHRISDDQVPVIFVADLRRDVRWCLATGVRPEDAAMKRLERVRDAIDARLKGLPAIESHLRAKLDVADGGDFVLELMSAPSDSVMVQLHACWVIAQKDAMVALRLAELTSLLLPWCIDTCDPASRAGAADGLHLAMKANHLSIAEVVVAGAERRPAHFRKHDAAVIGSAAIMEVLDHGVDATGVELVSAVRTAIHEQFDIAPADIVEHVEWQRRTFGALSESETVTADDAEDLPLYYAYFGEERAPAAVEELQRQIPSLRVVRLDRDEGTRTRDYGVRKSLARWFSAASAVG